MEDYDETPPSLPANYITIVDLQKRWMEQQQKKHLHLKQETDTPTEITSRTNPSSHFQRPYPLNPNFRNRNRNPFPPESSNVVERGLTVQVQQPKQEDSSNHIRIITHTENTYPKSQFHQSKSYGNPNFKEPDEPKVEYKKKKKRNKKKNNRTADGEEDDLMKEVAVSRPKTVYLGNRSNQLHRKVIDIEEEDQTAEIEPKLKELSVSENESVNPNWAKRNWGERGRNMAAVRNWGQRGRNMAAVNNTSRPYREMVWVKRTQSNVQSSHD